MSLGISVSDFITTISLARSTYRRCKDAPNEFAEATREVDGLHTVLCLLQEDADNPESLLRCKGVDRQKELRRIILNCEVVLGHLKELLDRYASLGTASRRTWDRM